MLVKPILRLTANQSVKVSLTLHQMCEKRQTTFTLDVMSCGALILLLSHHSSNDTLLQSPDKTSAMIRSRRSALFLPQLNLIMFTICICIMLAPISQHFQSSHLTKGE
ncbi:hypothetical protein M8J77_001242 [Diaphorina citri]|nr:hypothetical protein M8J77_001242 [Diaphorina citri]